MFWDKEQVYDEQISPLMRQIIAICKEHQMPIVCTVQYCHREQDEGPGTCTTTITHWPHTHDVMRRLNEAHQRRFQRPVCLAETVVTAPDGSQSISVRRVT